MQSAGTYRVIDSEGREWQKITYDGYEWWVRAIDSTHFAMSSDQDFSSSATYHVRQLQGEPEFYEALIKWLKGREMIGGKVFE
jgi:hypothetical protein